MLWALFLCFGMREARDGMVDFVLYFMLVTSKSTPYGTALLVNLYLERWGPCCDTCPGHLLAALGRSVLRCVNDRVFECALIMFGERV